MSGSNIFTSALIGESWWEVGGDATINYHFAQDFGFVWSSSERALFDQVFRAYEAVCNVTFAETDRASAEIVENKVTTELARKLRAPELTWHGWHDEPGSGERSGFFDYTRDYWSNPAIGGRAHWLVLHEIGHALGLEHPHSAWHGSALFPGVGSNAAGDAGDNGLNSVLTTVMSYRLNRTESGDVAKTFGQVSGPMAFDIAALQEIYGEREYQTGDTVYVLPGRNGAGTTWTCIWDTGGTDAIVYAGALNATIDLRYASLQNKLGGGGWFSSASGILGGYSIANGVVIENASSGSGNDKISGNSAANLAKGRAGHDIVWGRSGDDLLYGGPGDDKLYGGKGSDVLSGGGGRDKLYLGNDADQDTVLAGNLDEIHQFDSTEDKIDISRLDVDWVKIFAQNGDWIVSADYDDDPQVELTITVTGQRPLLSDLIL